MELPTQFGKYQLLDRIATGGMAEVFLARSFGVEGFEKRLVIKRILPQLARSPHFVGMFIREAKISVSLAHPNIVQVFDLGIEGEDHYIAMEYIHGRDLTRTVRRMRAQGERLPLAVSVYVTAGLARGLAYAHSRVDAKGQPSPILHRDVSPHNVMLSFAGEVKLVDFGIARLMGAEEAPTGQPGGGKFAYMSPEQANGEAIDHRSDVYSCGIVLYELLVNHRLFQHDDPQEKLRRVREAVVPDPRPENPEVSERLWAILQKALARHPADRYATATDLETDLRTLLFEEGRRMDDALLGDFLRGQFAHELGPDPFSSQIQGLARQLAELEQTIHTDPSELQTGQSEPSDSPHSEPTPARALGEKKPVAVLMGEVVGLTDVSEVVEPEELVRQQQQLLRAVRRVADRYHGYVEAFGHDTLCVVFGVPLAREDDIQRAVSCADELLRSTMRLRKRGNPVDLALGVHRGEVAVSGTEDALELVPRGDTMKLARRLAAAAEPGELLASEEVADAVRERWRFKPGPRIRIKGRPTQRDAFVLVGRRRAMRGPGGRWVRRDRELETVAAALHRLAKGRGGAVAVVGEAGTGKSRLFRELQRLAESAGVPLYVARTVPYGAEHPLGPFRDLMAQLLGIDEEHSAAEIRTRLARLGQLRLDEAEIDIIGSLFALPGAGGPAPSAEAILSAGSRFIRGLGDEQSSLIVLEDLQHLTPLGRELLNHMLRASVGRRILWFLSWRGDGPEGALVDQRIELGALSRAASRSLVGDVLGARRVDPDILKLVERSAEGNPLYIEEVAKALAQRGVVLVEDRTAQLVRDSEPVLPPTLEGILAARVDALDPGTKGTLQLAATVGLSFSPALVAEGAGLDDPEPLFQDLVDAGLIVPSGEGYGFASHLVWQVVRGGILKVQLKDQHRLVSEAIERLYADRIELHTDALARHCALADRLVDAAQYANQAGDRHRAGSMLERAHSTYRQGVTWLTEAARRESQLNAHAPGEAVLRMKAGEVAVMLGRLDIAEPDLLVALELAAECGMGALEARCHVALGRLYQMRGELHQANANLEQALLTARLSGDARAQVEALEVLAALDCDRGDYAQAEARLAEALSQVQGDPHLRARVNLGLGVRYLRDDRPEQAWPLLDAARTAAEQTEDRILQGRIYNNLGLVQYALGAFDVAVGWFRRALEHRRGTGYAPGLVVNHHNIGGALLRMGEPAAAWQAFSEGRMIASQAGLESLVIANQLYLDYLAGISGDEQALERLDVGLQRAEELGAMDDAATARWLQGRLLKQRGEAEAAGRMLDDALARARSIGARFIARDVERELL